MKNWDRWRELDLLQKILILFQIAMVVFFAAAYLITGFRNGFRYRDALLYPSREGTQIVYTGKVEGQRARFTVSGGTVTYRWGETDYGPFIVQLDPAAAPKGESGHLTGVEVREGETILFRGGWEKLDIPSFARKDKKSEVWLRLVCSDGTVFDSGRRRVDAQKPTVNELLQITSDPELTHRGRVSSYLLGTFLVVLNLAVILYADELFRWQLSFHIRRPERAEPSEWEFFLRKACWVMLIIAGLLAYIDGLHTIL